MKKKNIKDLIKKLDQEGKVVPATTDAVFKALLQDKSMKDNLAFIISEVTKIKKNYLLENMVFGNTEIPKENVALKANTTDLLVNVLNKCILLEMNKFNSAGNEFRNNAYFYSSIAKSIKINDDYNNIKQIYQINFDYEKAFTERLISEIIFMDRETGIVDNEFYKKYRINLVKVREKYYNNFENLSRFEKLLLILQLDSKKELRKVSKGDEGLMAMVNKIEDMSKKEEFVSFYDEEKLDKLCRDIDINEAKKEAIKEGIAEGKAEGKAEGIIEGSKKNS